MVRKEKRKMEKASKEREKKKGKVIGNCQSKNYSGCNDAKYTICILYNLYFLDYPKVPVDYDFCEIQLWDVNGKTNFPRLLPNLKTPIDKR